MIRPRGYCTLRYKRPASSCVAALHPLRDALQARHPVHARGSPVLPERPTRFLAVGDERGGPVLGGLAPTVDAVVGAPHRVNRRREKIDEQSIPVTRVDAVVFKDIVAEISNQYPALEHDELMEMAVAIDGEIIHTPFLEKVAATSEVHFLYRISGG